MVGIFTSTRFWGCLMIWLHLTTRVGKLNYRTAALPLPWVLRWWMVTVHKWQRYPSSKSGNFESTWGNYRGNLVYCTHPTNLQLHHDEPWWNLLVDSCFVHYLTLWVLMFQSSFRIPNISFVDETYHQYCWWRVIWGRKGATSFIAGSLTGFTGGSWCVSMRKDANFSSGVAAVQERCA